MMNAPSTSARSRALPWLTALFILSFFTFFSYRGLSSYFTLDDGTTILVCLKPFETPVWRDLLHILTVFTAAFRPLTTLFWRPLYAVFGFDPLPFRIVVHLLMMLNIGVAYVLARRLEMTREGAALTALIFCYNASTVDLYYNTCLVADVMCFLFYGLAMIAFTAERRHVAAGIVCFLLALDSKEMAVTLPGVLLLFEVIYRRDELRDKQKVLRVGGVIAGMLMACGIYLAVKVTDMSQNSAYAPHVTVGFVLKNIAHYLEGLIYLPENTLTPLTAGLILGAIIGVGALLRSRAAIFGVLYFVTALIPVAVIDARSGYAAYVPYFGLALAVGAILNACRARIGAMKPRRQTATAVMLFLCTAIALGCAHAIKRLPTTQYYEWSTPALVGLLEGFRQTIPEFPPGARVLLDKDPWGPDWGQMFLLRLLYHDNSVWVDRTKNMERPPDLKSYDLVVSYTAPDVEVVPAKWFKHLVKWEARSRLTGTGQLLTSSPNAHGAAPHVAFAPATVKRGESTTLTVPGLANVGVNVVYRTVSEGKSTVHVVREWCTLDEGGRCTVSAPSKDGQLLVDWLQPADQRWILTSGLLVVQ
jgi:hypothetical protein